MIRKDREKRRSLIDPVIPEEEPTGGRDERKVNLMGKEGERRAGTAEI
jgi:hypothetical protein